MPTTVTVFCGTCGGPMQAAASALNHQDPPATAECPTCCTTVQVST